MVRRGSLGFERLSARWHHGELFFGFSVYLCRPNVSHYVELGPLLSSENDLLFSSIFAVFFNHVTTVGGASQSE